MGEGVKVYGALLEAKREFKPVEKSAENPHFRSSYVPLSEYKAMADPILHKHGLLVIQPHTVESDEHGVTSVVVVTRLIHAESGEEISVKAAMPLADLKPQAVGSAITYAQRYQYKGLLGLSDTDDDDDGNGAQGTKGTAPLAQPQRASAKKVQPEPDVQPFQREDGKMVLAGARVQAVSVKQGTGTKGPWTKWGVRVGETWYSTFARELGEMAEQAKKSGAPLMIVYEADKKGYLNIVELLEQPPDNLDSTKGAEPEPPKGDQGDDEYPF